MEPSRRLGSSVLDHVQLCKLFVGGLRPDTDELGLRGHFEAFGTLKDCVVVMNAQTNRSRRFGFITFSSVFEADRAMAAAPHAVDGTQVEVKRAVSREDSCKPGAHARVKKIFVGGLKGEVGESDLVKHFSQFGPVEKAEIIINKQSGKKRGFGFVHFVDHDTADKAAVVKFHPIQGHRVEVKKALPKGDLDPWGLDLPMPGSSCTWRPSNRARSGHSSSPTPDPGPKPNPSPTPNPTPFLNPILKPAEWPGPIPAEWSGPKLAGWLGPKLIGWPGPKPPGWPGPKPPENTDDKPPGCSTLDPDGDRAPKSVGGPDSKSAGGPDGGSDPQFEGSLIPTVAWIPYPKPGWIPNPKIGFGPHQKPGWEPDPKLSKGPNPKPVEDHDPNPPGQSWAPESKPGTGPVSNPVLTSKFRPRQSPGLDPKIIPVLNLGYGPKPEPNGNSGLGPRPRPGPNPSLKPRFPGPRPRPRLGLLGPGPSPNPGFGRGSGPRYQNASQGLRDPNGRRETYRRCGTYGGGNQSRTSYDHNQHRAAFGPMKRRCGGWEYRGGSFRGAHRGGAAGTRGT